MNGCSVSMCCGARNCRTSYVEWRDSALLSMEVEIVGRDVLKVRFYLKWRDSALLSMEVEAVGRRRAEGTFSLFCGSCFICVVCGILFGFIWIFFFSFLYWYIFDLKK